MDDCSTLLSSGKIATPTPTKPSPTSVAKEKKKKKMDDADAVKLVGALHRDLQAWRDRLEKRDEEVERREEELRKEKGRIKLELRHLVGSVGEKVERRVVCVVEGVVRVGVGGVLGWCWRFCCRMRGKENLLCESVG